MFEVVLRPRVEFPTIKGDPLLADRYKLKPRAHVTIKPVLVHAEIARRVPQANEPRDELPRRISGRGFFFICCWQFKIRVWVQFFTCSGALRAPRLAVQGSRLWTHVWRFIPGRHHAADGEGKGVPVSRFIPRNSPHRRLRMW